MLRVSLTQFKRSQTTLAVLLCLTAAVNCRAKNKSDGPQTSEVVNGIPNFREVAPGVYRGGQPTTAGWAFLKSKGVRTTPVRGNFAGQHEAG